MSDNETGQTALTDDAVTSHDETPETDDELKQAAIRHAEETLVDHPSLGDPIDLSDVRFEISHRMKRTAGRCIRHRPGGSTPNDGYTIRLARRGYDNRGYDEFLSTVRHELVHVWQYEVHDSGDHGETFAQWTDILVIEQHCEHFTDFKYLFECQDCGTQVGRYRKSKFVKKYKLYNCGSCGGSFEQVK